MPAQPLGPTGLLAQSMALPAGSQSMSMGGMGLRAQGMDGRKKSAGPVFSSSVQYVSGGNGSFSGTTFVFTASFTVPGDWIFVMADGVNATSVTGNYGTVLSTKLTLANASGTTSTLFYGQAVNNSEIFTINGGTSSGPAEWVAYSGLSAVTAPQAQISVASAPTLVFSAPVLTNNSSRLLAILSAHSASPPAGTWSAPAIWNARVSWNLFGPKFLGDALSSAYQQAGAGPITFTMPGTQTDGQVGWLFELVGT